VFKSCRWRELVRYSAGRFRGGLERCSLFNNISNSTIEKVLCSMSEPVVIFNENMRVVWTNPSAELYFGHSTEVMAGKRCTEFFRNTLECIENCPVEKSFASEEEETLVVDDLLAPRKLIDAIPFTKNSSNLVMAVVHSVPEIDRDKAIRREFAALLNNSATLEDAANNILCAVKNLTSVSSCGIYTASGNSFALLRGCEAPKTISDEGFNSPVYLSQDRLPFSDTSSFPDGAAIVPVVTPDGSVPVLLFAGRGTMCTNSRNRLEMMSDVLSSCVLRLLPHG